MNPNISSEVSDDLKYLVKSPRHMLEDILHLTLMGSNFKQ